MNASPVSASDPSGARAVIDLAGEWRFARDAQDEGVAARWFLRDLPGVVTLPGDLGEQGLGDPIGADTEWTGEIVDRSYFTSPAYAPHRAPGAVKIPFWLQPESRYVGAAWYQRDILVPGDWRDLAVSLHLERPHIVTRVWIDDQELDAKDSLSTPHDYAIPSITAGRHRLTIRVDNRPPVEIGVNSHSITDHTQGNWNGIVGRLELRAFERIRIEQLQVATDASTRAAHLSGRVVGAPAAASLTIEAEDRPDTRVRVTTDEAGVFVATLPLGTDAALWDEFQPALHTLVLTPDGGLARRVRIGLRSVSRDGDSLLINGRRLFLRGALDCAVFPRTGHPPTDPAFWRNHLANIQSWGLNHLRFHSWCPPRAAFDAADEAGVYLQVECSVWPNAGATLGDGRPLDEWLHAETERIIETYGNHPSFLLLASGNEPAGRHHADYLARWVSHFKTRDPRRLYTSAAGWPALAENDYHNVHEPRIQGWGEGLNSRVNAQPPATFIDYASANLARFGVHPVVSHEIGQWCAYPNLAEVSKYTGYLKAKNLEIFRSTLDAHGLGDLARDFLLASGKLQTLLYKEEIESSLRTRNQSGFQLLGLQDFPGQGTAPVGVLDAFWEPKGYVTAAEYRRFCGPTVPLARLPRRVFTSTEKLIASLEVSHFGPAPLRAVRPTWRLVDDRDRDVLAGELPAADIPVGPGTLLGHLSLSLESIREATRCRLIVRLGAEVENDWDVWVYPADIAARAPANAADSVVVLRSFGAEAIAALEAGKRVLCALPPEAIADDPSAPVAFGFSTIFWNTAWTRRQAPTTLGLLCDPAHPALADFPTDAHTNWQWWFPIRRARPFVMQRLPADLRPIVHVIDDWFTNRRLGLVFEASFAHGRLLLVGADLLNADDPVCRQLLASLTNYAASPAFAPRVRVEVEDIQRLLV